MSGQRDAGSAAHVGIEIINRGNRLEDAMIQIDEYIDTLRVIRQPDDYVLPPLNKLTDPEWCKVRDVAESIVKHYIDWISEGNDIGVEFLAVEKEWEVRIAGYDITVYGMMDAALFDPAVGLVIRDNKTVATFGQTPMDVDFQLLTYAWAFWRMTGEVPKRAEHLMFKRVKYGGTAKPPFVQQYQIRITKLMLEKHEQHILQRCLEMQGHATLSVTNPWLWPNPTKDCSWDCDFKIVCPMVDDGSDYQDVLDEDFTLKLVQE